MQKPPLTQHQALTAANLAELQKSHMQALQSTLRRDGVGQYRRGASSSATEIQLTLDSTMNISGKNATSAAADHVNDLTQQLDALSIASSTHFTMINGFGAAGKKIGRGCCCCKPIAAVIITMTGLFLLIICAVVLMAECKWNL